MSILKTIMANFAGRGKVNALQGYNNTIHKTPECRTLYKNQI